MSTEVEDSGIGVSFVASTITRPRLPPLVKVSSSYYGRLAGTITATGMLSTASTYHTVTHVSFLEGATMLVTIFVISIVRLLGVVKPSLPRFYRVSLRLSFSRAVSLILFPPFRFLPPPSFPVILIIVIVPPQFDGPPLRIF